ncbi:PHD/FYVE-zinc-finger like domain-containing protein [Annulohypoxylon bovei var. microspora]|nr:PHD/FYVE-zinc-finger like domain-containing protein [Annulohypoxylon bovei var. microspora]
MDSSEDEDNVIIGGRRGLSYDENDMDGSSVNRTRRSRSSRSQPPPKSRQFPIQVVLRPPPDPTEYERIEPSQSVERVLGEIEVEDEVFYSIEYDDGYIEEIAHDHVLQLPNGFRAAQQFQQQGSSVDPTAPSRSTSKRPHSDDEYYDSSGADRPRKKRQKPPVRPDRRSARHSSSRTSGQANRRALLGDGQINGVEDEWEDISSDDVEEAKSGSKKQHSSFVGLTTGRITRSKNTSSRSRQVQDESEDELAQSGPTTNRDDDDDDEFMPFIRSDIGGAKRTSSRKRRMPKMRHTSMKRLDGDSEIEFETRRSKRSNRTSKSMRDPDIDEDYEAVEYNAPSVPQISSIKETFHNISGESDFGKVHASVCESCNTQASHGKGPLIPCQGCSYSYHKPCIGNRSQRDHRVTKVGANQFVLQCRFCIGSSQKDKRTPNHSVCQTCKIPGISCAEFSAKKTPKQEEKARLDNGGEDPVTHVQPSLVNNPGNVMFRCSTCKRGYHFEHLPPIAPDHVGSENIRHDRVHEYSLEGWKCKDCLEAKHRIHALVAWRPTDQSIYQDGQTGDEFANDEIEYLVKWDGRSHCHDAWMPGAWVYGVAASTMRSAFHKQKEKFFPKMTTESAVEEEWVLADVFLGVKYRRGFVAVDKLHDLECITDVVSVFVKFQGLNYQEAVWDEPPPRNSGARWGAFYNAYEEFLNGKYFISASDEKMIKRIKKYRDLDFGEKCELKTQPPSLTKDRSLMLYQMEGVNWLLFNFHQQKNMVLADEMGLGKTIQIVSFVSSLALDKPCCWPFLIVVPSATCPNWRRELKSWSPSLRVVTYHGGKTPQDLAYRHELFPNGVKDGMKAHVVIMSYDAANTIKNTFPGVNWVGLIVDEGQRLKNEDTQLYKTLVELKVPCRILLTGTPLQNNKRELFNLLQFIDSKHNAEKLDAEYDVLTKENLPELHQLIRPHFLRRTKAQVLKFLPPMAQIIVPVTMTVLQEKLSKSIIARNPELIKAIISKGKMKAGDRKNLSNIIADLRQCLCHPFCFNNNVEDKTLDYEQTQRNLIEASPKFLLLEIMLPKLKERGHRVLIFSQFLGFLNIMEDFLDMLGLPFGRIDGNLDALKKQRQIDAFNDANSPLFAMLLSTRAGGVGINLATADTVIICDPDWNPHQDIQAISRAHRIGQRKKVLCFQLTTKNTVEENIMQAGRKKMALDHALIESLDAKDDSSHDIESILKQGAESLFSDKDKVKITYDSASVDKLLDRSQMENTGADDETPESQFSIARVWANDSGSLTDNLGTDDNGASAADTSVWENILKAREEEHQRELAATQEVYGRGARRRNTKGVDYNSTNLPEADSGGSDVDIEDELYIDNGVEVDNDDGAYEEEERVLSRNKRAKASVPAAAASTVAAAPEINKALTVARELTTSALKTPQNGHRDMTQMIGPTPQARAMPLSQAMAQPQILPHQRPPLRFSLPSDINPNLVASMPGREQLLTKPSTKPSTNLFHLTSNVPLPTPSSKVLKSTQITTPSTSNELPNGSSNTLSIFPIDERGTCLICRARHPADQSCIDFSSQISLRIAIDSLRVNGDQPNVRSFRDLLINQLRRLSGR